MFWIRLLTFNIPLAVVAVGLFFLRKWAALLFSTAGLYIAFWACKDALDPLSSKPGDWSWIGWIYAVLFTIPAIVTVRYWSTLAWRRRKTPPPPPPLSM
jgi:hypothetical protein